MSRLVISFVIAMGISSAALGAEKPQALPDQISPEQRPLAQKLTEQQMTQGLTTETPSGAPGLVYQGGVAGYSGPTRESDNRIGTSLQAETDRQSATQKAVEDLGKAVVEQKNGADVQKALRQSQTAIQAQFDETTRALQQQQTNPSPNTRRGGGTASSQTAPQQGNLYGGQNNSGDLITACGAKGLTADFVTGNCVSPQNGQTNPLNLYQPFTAPVPIPQPNDSVTRCGAMGRAVDLATGRCM